MIQPLTSLRFLFAILIFLHHYPKGEHSVFPEGYLGVSFFFILSGFVLTLGYQERLFDRKIDYTSFVKARIAKLYPIHLLCFVGAAVLMIFSLGYKNILPAISNLLLLQSWIPQQSYYFSFNAVSWCLSDEMFFYFVFPFMLAFIAKTKRTTIFSLFILVFCLYLLLIQVVPEPYLHAVFYINPLVRSFDFCVGILLCFLFRFIQKKREQKIKKITGLQSTGLEILVILLAVLFVYYSSTVPQVYRYAVYYWIPMSCIILLFSILRESNGLVTQILSNKYLVIAGNASFCFYMIHTLVIQACQVILKKTGLEINWTLEFIIALSLTLFGSIVCYYKFEKPMNQFIKKRLNI